MLFFSAAMRKHMSVIAPGLSFDLMMLPMCLPVFNLIFMDMAASERDIEAVVCVQMLIMRFL